MRFHYNIHKKGFNMNNNIDNLINNLVMEHQFKYYGLKGICELIINNKETNTNKIEHMLDALLDSYYYIQDAKVSFINLCNYYETINKDAADDYRQIFNEEFGEKILKKTNN